MSNTDNDHIDDYYSEEEQQQDYGVEEQQQDLSCYEWSPL